MIPNETYHFPPNYRGGQLVVEYATVCFRSQEDFGPVGPMEFSASHYTAQDLDSAYHTYDLYPRAEVILSLDYRQRGLGTESCGPGPLEQYKIEPGRYSWSYTLQPLEA